MRWVGRRELVPRGHRRSPHDQLDKPTYHLSLPIGGAQL